VAFTFLVAMMRLVGSNCSKSAG